jgi:hypothetical protein
VNELPKSVARILARHYCSRYVFTLQEAVLATPLDR